jgi:AraC family transcriptional activator of pobA
MIDKIKLNTFTDKTDLENLTKDTKQFFAYLIFFENGNGYIKINNTNAAIDKNSISSLPILSTIDYSEIETNVNGWCIAFDKDARDILLTHSFQLFCPFTGIVNINLEKMIFDKLISYLKDIKLELERKYNAYSEIIYLQNALIIKYLKRNITNANSTSQLKDIILKKFADLVNDEFKNHHDIEYFANKLSVSSKTLDRLAKQQLNISPKQIIQYRINAEAIRLLIHTQENVKEIAYELNFSSPDYFNFFFKKLNKISPSAYKNKMSENLRFMS